MKKTISRMLALLLTLVILMSGMSTALASAVQELGSIEDVEQLLFEAVMDVFPTSTLEQQYIYAQYYEENGNAAAVENLLASLNSEQLIAFTNFKAEHGCTCYDEAENLICEGVEVCECLCHKVDAFEANMDVLLSKLDSLESMGMDAVRQFIVQLRYEEIVRAMMRAGLIPSESVNESYDSFTPPFSGEVNESEPEVALLSVAAEAGETEETSEEQTDAAQKALNTFNKQAADSDTPVDVNSEMGVAVSDVLNQNVITAQSFGAAYGDTADYSGILSLSDENSTLTQVLDLLTADPIMLAAEIEEDENVQIETVASTADDSNIKYTLYNFGNGDGVSGFSFRALKVNGEMDCTPYIEDSGAGSDADYIYSNSSVTGASVCVEPSHDGITKNLNGAAFPTINGVDLASVFNGNEVASKYGAGLFRDIGNGYMEYDSYKNAASYSNGKFTLYDGIVYPYYYRNSVTGSDDYKKGNFLPFNSLTGNVGQVKNSDYGYDANGNYTAISPKRYYLKGDNKVDLWFGMVIEFDFYMPEKGKVNGQDMVFDFTGDDDVLVYIDDVLMLDISGMHGPLEGNINFATGNVEFQSAAMGTKTSTTIAKMVTDADGASVELQGGIYKDFSKHTLKFYYMERAGGRSICQLKFNMPTLPPGGLSVEKELSEDSLATATSDVAYSFELKEKDGSVVSNAAYDLYEDGNKVEGTYKTEETGVFYLKANQRAHFTSLEADKTYAITEQSHTFADSCETKWTVVDNENVDGKVTKGSTAEVYVAPKETTGSKVTFTNTLKTTTLTVNKNVYNPRPVDADNVYTFEASICHGLEGTTPLETVRYLQGEDDTEPTTLNADSNGKFTFTMKADDEPITFIDLPIGATVTITEVNTPAKGEVKAVNVADFALTAVSTYFAEEAGMGSDGAAYTFTGVMSGVEGSTVTFTNTPQIYDLTITKAGLDMDIDPYSSTMYSVVCKDNNIDMTVAIYGNKSVTIRDLPVGTYTVNELTDWSWRYSSSSDRNDNKVTLTGTDDTITFTNTRVKDKWLDSDCYAENTFDGSSAADRRPSMTN